ncbi:MAG TPA: DUF5591 domain-containing protein, partial [Thermoplasmata archaeon]|nr:DUF5591 domain-containing protein [Thermoplasmata archaeon]
VRAVAELRERLGAEPILWAPRVALPNRLALLAYLGVDLVDSTETLWQASEDRLITSALGEIDPEAAALEGLCDCSACRSGAPRSGGEHAEDELSRELRLVRTAIRTGRLRELVEARTASDPALSVMLRQADRLAGALLEERSPVTGAGIRGYVLKESHRRPEVRRFRARFLERYRPPPSKQVLLLVPCSKTKPYRNSRSHRRLARALEGLPNLPRLHVVSVTSPLGLVPREIEDLPPARHYDIPVTGDWDEEERGWVRTALAHLLKGAPYRRILVHLDPREYGFLEETFGAAPDRIRTLADDRTTSAEALRSLRAAATEALSGSTAVAGGALATVREELESLAALQFGRPAAEALFRPPVRLHGRPWFQRITDGGGRDLATWQESRGLFQLTVAGGVRLQTVRALEVEVRADVPMKGDLFVPGVEHADPLIRAGDAVCLVRGGSLLAVGEAEMSGRMMQELSKGLAVHLRHRVPGPDEGGDR